MGKGIGWLIAAALVYLLARHPIPVVVTAVSLVVYWDFGLTGLGILWPLLLVVETTRR
jgi:hypothetical protein